MVIEQSRRSTDTGKDKMDLGELIRIILVLPSLSFNLYSSGISFERYMTEWTTPSWKVQRQVL